MRLAKPQMPAVLEESGRFAEEAAPCREDEYPLRGRRFREASAEGEDFYRLEVEQCVFQGCDLSNSRFRDGYFCRVQLEGCKCVGADLTGAVLKHTAFQRCQCGFAALDKARLTVVSLEDTDLTKASLSEVRLKSVTARDAKFVHNNLFKTELAGMDFTRAALEAPTLSASLKELKGAKITVQQAADLIRLWGVIVE